MRFGFWIGKVFRHFHHLYLTFSTGSPFLSILKRPQHVNLILSYQQTLTPFSVISILPSWRVFFSCRCHFYFAFLEGFHFLSFLFCLLSGFSFSFISILPSWGGFFFCHFYFAFLKGFCFLSFLFCLLEGFSSSVISILSSWSIFFFCHLYFAFLEGFHFLSFLFWHLLCSSFTLFLFYLITGLPFPSICVLTSYLVPYVPSSSFCLPVGFPFSIILILMFYISFSWFPVFGSFTHAFQKLSSCFWEYQHHMHGHSTPNHLISVSPACVEFCVYFKHFAHFLTIVCWLVA